MAVKQIGLRPRSLWGERDKIVWLREARGAVCCCTGEGEVGTMDIQGRLQRRRPSRDYVHLLRESTFVERDQRNK